MLDQITGLRVLLKVAGLGSFSAAARALDMSQTMATKHVAAVEERLGAKLFHRSTRKLTPTDAGLRYFEICERLLDELDEAEASIAADHLEPRGTLRLNVPVSFGVNEVMPALNDYAALHPAVSIDLGLNDRLVDLVDEGWDAAIRIGRLKDSRLLARRLAPCRMVVCASPAYLAAAGTPRTLADLARHNCLGYTLSTLTGADNWSFGEDGNIAVPISGNLRASNGDAVRLAAIAGRGLIYQPTFIIGGDLRAGRLVSLSLDQPTPQGIGIYAVTPSRRYTPAKISSLISFLAARWSPDPPWDSRLSLSEGD